MEREDDQQLWDLLGRSEDPKLSPFFARNVLRKLHQEEGRFERMRSWFSLRRLVAASAAATVVIGTAIAIQHPLWQKSLGTNSEPDVLAKIDPQDYDVVADLDELSNWDDNSLWDQKPTL
jgi:hypothetical protein